MAIYEIRVRQTDVDVIGEGVLHEVRRTLNIPKLKLVRTAKVYRLEGITKKQVELLTKQLFYESINQEFALNSPIIKNPAPNYLIEVAYRPGVMNPEAASIIKSAEDLGIKLLAADSSMEYGFNGKINPKEVTKIVDRFLVNKIVQRIITVKPQTLLIAGKPGPVTTVQIRHASEEELLELSKDKLFLNLEEMKVVQNYFNQLKREPTDCELEIIAARWSEHCGHKTFKAKVIVDGIEKLPLYTRIKEASYPYFGDLVLSAFFDNSGVMRFYEGQAICGKVETHNSPSAIEPYGGAATGSGGVFRDPAGTGQGAEIFASTDMFCFAPWSLKEDDLPTGCLHPDYLQRRVVAGVGDYGNRMGIPTNNGSVHYHPDFKAKPSVIVGAYGILPIKRSKKGKPKKNDLLIMVGGKTGRDGIHGATFSSGEMTERTINVNAAAVQIGNAIEEKRTFDALIEARDKGLVRAITDCGAAGLSSAVGEIGEDIGVTVDISKVPLKYQGLAPWEIWLSEAQERMVLAVNPVNLDKFMDICRKYNVEATILGSFDGTNQLTVNCGKQNVAKLDYKFLKHGLPQRVMKANWEKPHFKEREIQPPKNWARVIKKVLAHGNVCSKEPIIRRYDHGVQGTNVLPPLTGAFLDAPNDAVVLTPILGKDYGVVISHGLNPALNKIDPYEGSKWAVAEAMANFVAVGGNPQEACLINNYIWPFPDGESMGSLDRCVDAVCDCMHALRRPVISGKDSLSSTYRGKDGTIIKIPPVLCISVFGRIPSVKQTVTSDIKKEGSILCLVGKLDDNLGGSIYFDISGQIGNMGPRIDLEILPNVLKGVYRAIKGSEVLACHDISEGGVITTMAEMCFGGNCGVEISLDKCRPDRFLFNETAGCFLMEVKDKKAAHRLFKDLPHQILGKTIKGKKIRVRQKNKLLFTISVDDLKNAWQAPLKEMF